MPVSSSRVSHNACPTSFLPAAYWPTASDWPLRYCPPDVRAYWDWNRNSIHPGRALDKPASAGQTGRTRARDWGSRTGHAGTFEPGGLRHCQLNVNTGIDKRLQYLLPFVVPLACVLVLGSFALAKPGRSLEKLQSEPAQIVPTLDRKPLWAEDLEPGTNRTDSRSETSGRLPSSPRGENRSAGLERHIGELALAQSNILVLLERLATNLPVPEASPLPRQLSQTHIAVLEQNLEELDQNLIGSRVKLDESFGQWRLAGETGTGPGNGLSDLRMTSYREFLKTEIEYLELARFRQLLESRLEAERTELKPDSEAAPSR